MGNGAAGGAASQFQTRHHRDANEAQGHDSTPFGFVHQHAAGTFLGPRYEVVHRGKSSAFQSTAPFANNDSSWQRATAHYGQPRTGMKTHQMQAAESDLFDAMRHPAGLGTTQRSIDRMR